MRRAVVVGIAAGALLVGCSEDDVGETMGTTESDEVSLSEVCTELTGELDRLRTDIGDIDSVDDLSDLDDVLGDGVERVRDAAEQLEDVEARGEDEQAVVDGLDEASSAAGRIGDEVADGDLGAARDQLDATGDALDEARERAADADIDCSA